MNLTGNTLPKKVIFRFLSYSEVCQMDKDRFSLIHNYKKKVYKAENYKYEMDSKSLLLY